MKPGTVTIGKVAEVAGVSKTTVSRFLNGRYEHMSEETKSRITAVIEELDYRPNAIARSLKSQKTGLIGVIVSDVTNPVTLQFMKGIIDYSTQEGYQVVTASSNENPEKEREYILSMMDRQVEGLVVFIADYNEYSLLEALKAKGTNIVLADRTINKPVFDMVTTDNYSMTRHAIKTLYGLGFEVVGLFSSDLLRSTVRLKRYNAFLDQSGEHVNDPEDLVYILHDGMEKGCKKELADFMAKSTGKKAAAFATTPMAMLNLLGAAYELGLRIPEDIGVCGYDNLQWSRLISGGISVIEQPFYDVGTESAKMLIKRIRKEINDGPQYVELSSKLILRNSTKIRRTT